MTTDLDRRTRIVQELADHLGSIADVADGVVQAFDYPTNEPEIPCAVIYGHPDFLVADEDEQTFCRTPATGTYIGMVLIQGDDDRAAYNLLMEYSTTVGAALKAIDVANNFGMVISRIEAPSRRTATQGGVPQDLMGVDIEIQFQLPDSSI